MTHHLQDLPYDARTVLFTGAKGGVGTSTVCVLHALALARAGFPATLTATSESQLADLAAILGSPTPEEPTIDVKTAADVAPSPSAARTSSSTAGPAPPLTSPRSSTTSSSARATSP